MNESPVESRIRDLRFQIRLHSSFVIPHYIIPRLSFPLSFRAADLARALTGHVVLGAAFARARLARAGLALAAVV
jgi:hypothetical protein